MNPTVALAHAVPFNRPIPSRLPLILKIVGIALVFFGGLYWTSPSAQEPQEPLNIQNPLCTRYYHKLFSHPLKVVGSANPDRLDPANAHYYVCIQPKKR
jgi:hypothetical protein